MFAHNNISSMILIDTHSHIYLDNFDKDRSEVIDRAKKKNVSKLLLPNIDSSSIGNLMKLSKNYPDTIYPMMGLHPTSVDPEYNKELEIVESWLAREKFYAIGETGIDLYWDRKYLREQILSFERQIKLALDYNLPIVIHARESFDEIFEVLDNNFSPDLKGVFHSFSGNVEQANRAIKLGFMLGIGGIVTFKNSGLDNTLKQINPENCILETDSPFLSPVPFRGKRNEPANLEYIGMKLASIYGMNYESIAEITSKNASMLFNI